MKLFTYVFTAEAVKIKILGKVYCIVYTDRVVYVFFFGTKFENILNCALCSREMLTEDSYKKV